jgi:hypothetical protein
MRIIGYDRVSTARQCASGLGIEAQRLAIDGFVAQRYATLMARFTVVESGRNPGTAGAEAGAGPRKGHRGDAGLRQAQPAVTQRRLPADAPGQRGEVRGGGPAGGGRPDRRDHGACRTDKPWPIVGASGMWTTAAGNPPSSLGEQTGRTENERCGSMSFQRMEGGRSPDE